MLTATFVNIIFINGNNVEKAAVDNSYQVELPHVELFRGKLSTPGCPVPICCCQPVKKNDPDGLMGYFCIRLRPFAWGSSLEVRRSSFAAVAASLVPWSIFFDR